MFAIPSAGPAIAYVYDIAHVLRDLVPLLRDYVSPRYFHQYGEDGLIDLYLNLTVHNFEVVSVPELGMEERPADLINSLNHLYGPASRLWDTLWFPVECSGSMAVLHRVRHVLWVVIVDPGVMGVRRIIDPHRRTPINYSFD